MQKLNLRKVATVVAILMLTGCAHHYTQAANNDPYGFFSGVWHGAIFPLTLVVNVFSWILSLVDIGFFGDVEIIGRPNTGFFYYLGFFIGLSSAGGSAA